LLPAPRAMQRPVPRVPRAARPAPRQRVAPAGGARPSRAARTAPRAPATSRLCWWSATLVSRAPRDAAPRAIGPVPRATQRPAPRARGDQDILFRKQRESTPGSRRGKHAGQRHSVAGADKVAASGPPRRCSIAGAEKAAASAPGAARSPALRKLQRACRASAAFWAQTTAHSRRPPRSAPSPAPSNSRQAPRASAAALGRRRRESCKKSAGHSRRRLVASVPGTAEYTGK
jgi:hypothetical protein